MNEQHIAGSSNPHAKWLREAAKCLASENRTTLAHTCDQAANEIDAIERHRTQFAERLADCEISLGTFDPGAVSEYWLKYAPGAMHTRPAPETGEVHEPQCMSHTKSPFTGVSRPCNCRLAQKANEPRCTCGASHIWPAQHSPNCPKHTENGGTGP